jgi:hypothetical protein
LLKEVGGISLRPPLSIKYGSKQHFRWAPLPFARLILVGRKKAGEAMTEITMNRDKSTNTEHGASVQHLEPESISQFAALLKQANIRYRRKIALGAPTLLLIYVAIIALRGYWYFPPEGDPEPGTAAQALRYLGVDIGKSIGWGFVLFTVIVGLVTMAIALVIYQFWIKPPVRDLELKLQDARNEVRAQRISSEEGWREVLWEELLQLTAGSLDDASRERVRKTHVTEARKILEGEKEGSLLEVETRISSGNSLIDVEEQERIEQLRWRNLSILIILLYISLALSLARLTEANIPLDIDGGVNTFGQSDTYGIPPRIFFWAGLGSLAAVLYRFYTFRGVVRFDEEVRWLIARPITGIIMGAMAYLALRAGFVLIGGSTTDSTGFPSSGLRVEIGVIIAFLGGFSDRFYEGLVDRLTSGLGRDETSTPVGNGESSP